MKQTLCCLLAVFILCDPLSGQFQDDFSDGNLNQWTGDVNHFIVNAAEQMQLSAPEGSTQSWIHTPVALADSLIWELYFKMDFAPSASNQLKILLALDGTDISTATGYFLEIGTNGDQDALEFKYLENGVPSSIASSAPAIVASQPAELTLRIERSAAGEWNIFKKTQTGTELLISASHSVSPLAALNTFGFQCFYTSTRRDKFFFDDIHIEVPLPDVTAPQCLDFTVQGSQTIELLFDEPLDATLVQNPSFYTLQPGDVHPADIQLNGSRTVITLQFATPFVNQQLYSLQITSLQDDAGNVMADHEKSFTYIQIDQATEYELLITEIMADPTPVISLPDGEYVEWYNNSDKAFRLSDYTLQVGSSSRALPDEMIQAHEYIILCDPDYATLLQSYGRVVAVDNFPALTNSGTTLSILGPGGNIIHTLMYAVSWYQDPDKSDGGWSLEMINPEAVCADGSNWAAANNLTGGTPGQENSQWNPAADITGPQIISFFTISDLAIEIRFDERLDMVLMENPNNFSFTPALQIQSIQFPNEKTVRLTLDVPLQEGIVYSTALVRAYDCAGNENEITTAFVFGLVADASPGDLKINEVLFNPATGGSRFIEIINTSDKFITLQNLAIARLTQTDQDIYPTGAQEVIAPDGYAVFTPDRNDILSRYTVPQPAVLYQSALPSWSDKTDQVSLLVNGEVIDSFTYQSEWHHPVIADQNGVSLERIATTAATTASSTWHSAASNAGYATPTGVNSQLLTGGMQEASPLLLVNKTFSPNDDGFKDFLVMQISPESEGAVTSVWIYDLEGRDIYQVANNELLVPGAILQWDGRNEEGLLAEMGIYIVFVRTWDVNGNVREYKETCALVKR